MLALDVKLTSRRNLDVSFRILGCACRASYCEIYNEALYDLLKFTKQQLQVRWDSSKGFYVPELAVKECSCVEDMLQVTLVMTTHTTLRQHIITKGKLVSAIIYLYVKGMKIAVHYAVLMCTKQADLIILLLCLCCCIWGNFSDMLSS